MGNVLNYNKNNPKTNSYNETIWVKSVKNGRRKRFKKI